MVELLEFPPSRFPGALPSQAVFVKNEDIPGTLRRGVFELLGVVPHTKTPQVPEVLHAGGPLDRLMLPLLKICCPEKESATIKPGP